jgi:hypothetical protein
MRPDVIQFFAAGNDRAFEYSLRAAFIAITLEARRELR